MFTIFLLVLTFLTLTTLAVFGYKKLFKTTTDIQPKYLTAQKPKPHRLLYYCLLVVMAIILPYILTVIFIIATGDRYEGMAKAVLPGILSVHVAFGLLTIQKNIIPKIISTIIVSALAFGLVYLGTTLEVIKTNIDIYSYWDIAITNAIAGIIVWEVFYQIDIRIIKKTRKE